MQHKKAESRKPGGKKTRTNCIQMKEGKVLQVYLDKQHFRHNNSILMHFLSSFIRKALPYLLRVLHYVAKLIAAFNYREYEQVVTKISFSKCCSVAKRNRVSKKSIVK